MRTTILLILFFFLIHQGFSQTKSTQPIEYIIVGVFCGECSGHCATMYKYNFKDKSNSILVDTTDSYFKNNGNIVFNTVIIDQQKAEIAQKVLRHIPSQLLTTTKPSESFGCPDCDDGCGIYFEFRKGGVVKHFLLDFQTNQLNGEIKEFTEYLKTTVGQLKIEKR